MCSGSGFAIPGTPEDSTSAPRRCITTHEARRQNNSSGRRCHANATASTGRAPTAVLSSTALYERMARERRLLHSRWDEYDTRHCVFQAKHLRPEELEEGYWRAYDEFYQWGSILRGAWAKPFWVPRLRHLAYAGAWKKFEPLWDVVIRAKQVNRVLPFLEAVVDHFRHGKSGREEEISHRGAGRTEAENSGTGGLGSY